ncbi:hypothetical protein [Lysobacter gummosus]|uniref:hypothetical protein n=1 Tax=Lysobacter gummosus TaxID=262324 RepID=UPI003631BD16
MTFFIPGGQGKTPLAEKDRAGDATRRTVAHASVSLPFPTAHAACRDDRRESAQPPTRPFTRRITPR